MFKRSRRKIVFSIMLALVLLWAGTLGVIYAASYLEMEKQNLQMLRAHAETYILSQSFSDMIPPGMPFPSDEPAPDPSFISSPAFQLSTFYSVALSHNGEVLEIRNSPQTVHGDEELEQLARQIVEEGNESGTKHNLSFYQTEKQGYLLVVFRDNTVVNESAMTLFRYTLIFGSVTLVLFFFLSLYLSGKIVSPLEESYSKQKQFISDAGHELKTPVSVISANAELLSREIGENVWLSNIRYENERMGLLVGQLLDLARTESVSSPKQRTDLSRLCAGEVLPFESVAFERGLALHTYVADGVTVLGNEEQLKQLVSILLDNAIRHSEESGDVYFSLVKEHSTARISVVNQGQAIPEEERERIFERFYRADAARGGEGNHYGLGLAIAKTIVVGHKGEIEVYCYDGYVEFVVRLPSL